MPIPSSRCSGPQLARHNLQEGLSDNVRTVLPADAVVSTGAYTCKKNGFRRDPPGTENTIGVFLFLKTSDFL